MRKGKYYIQHAVGDSKSSYTIVSIAAGVFVENIKNLAENLNMHSSVD